MCGIVGYVGRNEAAPILLEGLSRLEYRGYDSAGICVEQNGVLEVAKAKGRLQNLIAKTDGGAKLPGTLGIGHTRWATHGEPNDINSHPHVSQNGKIAVVHNGIIENYLEIREFLQEKGVQFTSQTDSEVVAQLHGILHGPARGLDGLGRSVHGPAPDRGRVRPRHPLLGRSGSYLSPRARTRRCCSASARARTSSPPT